MDIADIVSDEYETFSPGTSVSKLVGVFDDPAVKGVVVEDDGFEGVVTRRQLTAAHHQPTEKIRSLRWHVPHLTPTDDIREVAQLMIDSESQLLPVFEGSTLTGVVTADDILEKVEPFLDAATVATAATRDLVTLAPESTFGQAIHDFRDHHITHLPVVDDTTPIGILSLYDLVGVTIRPEHKRQAGDAGGVDSFGGDVADRAGRTRGGGYGARGGDLDRMVGMPVRDLMAAPVRTIHPDATLQTAVDEMFDLGGSSLVVTDNGEPFGILTKTDVLDALTWEVGGNRAVEVYGTEYLDDIGYDDIVSMVDAFDRLHDEMTILDAKIHLQSHKEQLRGTPLLLARIRLYTDHGFYIASGEGYGASHALHQTRDVIERQIRERKTHGRTKKPPDDEFWEKRFGWLLEE